MSIMSDVMILKAISPIHAGSGQALSAIDLPIQRERHTQWPIVQASGLKGALREHFRNFSDDKDLINFIFGLDNNNDKSKEKPIDEKGNNVENAPGAFAVSDAKIFAFPMRSDVAPFVHVTCPAVLKRLKQDLGFIGKEADFEIPAVNDFDAYSFKGDFNEKVILEDVQVEVKSQKTGIPSQFSDQSEELLIVSDEVFQYCVTSCTEVQTQIKIDSETGTAEDGALRYEELLPADSILYSVMYFQNAAFKNDLQAGMIKEKIKKSFSDFVQIGGDWTLGRGICKLSWFKEEGGNQ